METKKAPRNGRTPADGAADGAADVPARRFRAANGKGTVVARYRTGPDGERQLLDFQGSIRYGNRLTIYGPTAQVAEKKLDLVKVALTVGAIEPRQDETRRLMDLVKEMCPTGVLRMTQADVRRLLDRAKAERPTAGRAAATMHALLESWLQTEIAPPHRREGTHIKYVNNVQLMVPFIGDTPVRLFDVRNVDMLSAQLGTAKRTPGVISACIRNLRSALAFGEENDWPVKDKLVRRMRIPTPPGPQEYFAYSLEQLQILLLAAYKHRWGAAFILAGSMGLRRGEMFGLRWRAINWAQGTLVVESQLVHHTSDHQPRLVEVLKTTNSYRRLYLTKISAAALRRRQAQQQEERRRARSQWQETDLVFTTPGGGPLTECMINNAHERILAWAHVAEGTTHDLRRSCSTLLELAGTPQLVVERLLGHRRNPYRCAQAADLRQAAQTMDNLLNFQLDAEGCPLSGRAMAPQ